MIYPEAVMRCKKLELNKQRNLKYAYGKVRPHSRYETFLHFLTKAMVTKMVMDMGDAVLTEVEFANCRVVDVLQIKPKSNIVYEIESKGKNTKETIKGVDEVVIPLTKIPKKVKEGIEEFAKWLEKYIV